MRQCAIVLVDVSVGVKDIFWVGRGCLTIRERRMKAFVDACMMTVLPSTNSLKFRINFLLLFLKVRNIARTRMQFLREYS